MGEPWAEEQVIRSDDAGFPDGLHHISDPPPAIFARGALARSMVGGDAMGAAIAIVGARDATAYGLAVARDLAREIAARGLVVVSGLAVGIDAAAHRGALDAGGRTVAVVGTGTDVIYPHRNRELRAAILEHGAVLGELPCGTPPRRHHFPQRNRLISGLSLGVVVVEATLRSGSLLTARLALEQGREVFAVPGPVVSPRSRGPHSLLKAGAKLVETVDDVLEELPTLGIRVESEAHATAETVEAGPAGSLLRLVSEGVATVDQLAVRSGREVPEIWRDLLELELQGRVVRGPAGRFVPAFAGGLRGGAGGRGQG